MKATVEQMKSINQWQAQEYDNQLAFVSEYGKSLIPWLRPTEGESILDLGCGTGDLTHEISQYGVAVTGIDASSDMIAQAKKSFRNWSSGKRMVMSLKQSDSTMRSFLTLRCTGCESLEMS